MHTSQPKQAVPTEYGHLTEKMRTLWTCRRHENIKAMHKLKKDSAIRSLIEMVDEICASYVLTHVAYARSFCLKHVGVN